jgi:hypothetical protein
MHFLNTWLAKLGWAGRAPRRRDLFQESRVGLWQEDEEFVSAFMTSAPESHKTVATILRQIIAQECGLEPQEIVHTDKTDAILGLMEPSLAYFSAYKYDYVHVSSTLRRKYAEATGGLTPDFVRQDVLRYFGSPPGGEPGAGTQTIGEWIKNCLLDLNQAH